MTSLKWINGLHSLTGYIYLNHLTIHSLNYELKIFLPQIFSLIFENKLEYSYNMKFKKGFVKASLLNQYIVVVLL